MERSELARAELLLRVLARAVEESLGHVSPVVMKSSPHLQVLEQMADTILSGGDIEEMAELAAKLVEWGGE